MQKVFALFLSDYIKRQRGRPVKVFLNPNASLFANCTKYGLTKSQTVHMVKLLAQQQGVKNFTTNKRLLERALIPKSLSREVINHCANKGIELNLRGGGKVFLTHSIEEAIFGGSKGKGTNAAAAKKKRRPWRNKGDHREKATTETAIIFVEQSFFLQFLESVIRQHLKQVTQEPRNDKLWNPVISWLLFLGLHFCLFAYGFKYLLLAYVFFFVVRTCFILFGEFTTNHQPEAEPDEDYLDDQKAAPRSHRTSSLASTTNAHTANLNTANNIITDKKDAKNTNGQHLQGTNAPISFNNSLPEVTILIPLYKEEATLGQLTKALKAINYPPELLDIKFITEADDLQTNKSLANFRASCRHQIISVPPSRPRTKSKAINYGVRFALGKYICVFDAEDIPNPNQIITAMGKIEEYRRGGQRGVFSLQCPLSWYNWSENFLTMMMSIEYGILFDRLIPASSRLNGFIALGGTSNYFSKQELEELGYWNSYNVTEDFELSIRSANRGNTIKFCPQGTQEECVTNFGSWVKQRSRWIKGFIVSIGTNFLNLHLALWKKPTQLISFYIFGWVATIHPIMHALSLLNVFHLSLFPPMEFAIIMFVINLLAIESSSRGARFIENVITTLAFVGYNLLLVIPFFHAVIDLLRNYSHWNKTTHTTPKEELRLRRWQA